MNFDDYICNNSEVTLVFIGANSGVEYLNVENNLGDKNDLNPCHNGTELVNRVLNVCSNSKIVLIIFRSSILNINKWKYNDYIQAILFGGMLLGQGGNELLDIFIW